MKRILLIPFIFIRAFYFRYLTNNKLLPCKSIEKYGRILGLRNKSFHQFVNPISSTRYYEFEFCNNFIKPEANDEILDISSPYLFGSFINRYNNINYTYINPDLKDLVNVKNIYKKFNHNKLKFIKTDATALPFTDEYFSIIYSISVIEHINDYGDMKAVSECWRTLKEGCLLVLTFPTSKIYFEEYRDKNVYGLNVDNKYSKYFFQRLYDDTSIQNRILNKLVDYEIIGHKVYGETIPYFFEKYEKRWLQKGEWETVKDPYYMTKYFKEFRNLDELTGIFSITCLAIKKKG